MGPLILALAAFLSLASAQYELDPYPNQEDVYRGEDEILWCCLSEEELAKCEDFAAAVAEDNLRSDLVFGSYYRGIKCKLYFSRDECMRHIDLNKPAETNIMSLDAGEVFVGGRYHSLVPILKETYDGGSDYYHSLAVIKKDSLPNVRTMKDLRGLKSCFTKVGSLAGWTVPIYRLIKDGHMEVSDCNNHVKSAIDFFGTSCAVDSLLDRYNPLGDNPHHFCELCGSHTPGVRCTHRDPYAEYNGALTCLKAKGDLAFLNEKVIGENGELESDYEILCPVDDGLGTLERRPVSDYKDCSWGISPGKAIVVSSAMEMKDREAIQIFLNKAVELYGAQRSRTVGPGRGGEAPSNQTSGFSVNQDNGRNAFTTNDGNRGRFIADKVNVRDQFEEDMEEDQFRIFESSQYGLLGNLLFSDTTRSFGTINPNDMSYKSFLGRSYGGSLTTPMQSIEGVRKCPVGDMKLCVTSEAELTKCVRMRTALNAQLLEPKMSCKRAESHVECMRQIHEGEADVVVVDAGDVYRGGWHYGLVPIMAEIYNLGTPHYYAVAVTKQRDNSSELIYLKRKNTCHTGIGQAAGWIIPMAWLIGNERVRDYGCNSVRAAAEYFNKACAPGAHMSYFTNKDQENFWEYSHLCDLCHGQAGHYCDRNHMEDYYGHTGAFRCLVEGGGNVAFVKHTTVMENCDGKRKEWWARNQLTTDYELLCRDGTRAPARGYKDCFLGKVKANAIVTSPRYSKQKIAAFINLFKYAQQFYGQKVPDEFSFSMFYSTPPYADLIFQDATQQLIVLPEEERDYTRYLDPEFLRAYNLVECRSGAHHGASLSLSLGFILMVVNYLK